MEWLHENWRWLSVVFVTIVVIYILYKNRPITLGKALVGAVIGLFIFILLNRLGVISYFKEAWRHDNKTPVIEVKKPESLENDPEVIKKERELYLALKEADTKAKIAELEASATKARASTQQSVAGSNLPSTSQPSLEGASNLPISYGWKVVYACPVEKGATPEFPSDYEPKYDADGAPIMEPANRDRVGKYRLTWGTFKQRDRNNVRVIPGGDMNHAIVMSDKDAKLLDAPFSQFQSTCGQPVKMYIGYGLVGKSIEEIGKSSEFVEFYTKHFRD